MYQITAMYGDDEVGYAEGEDYTDALRECAESVPSVYPDDDVFCVAVGRPNGIKVSTTLEAVKFALEMI